MKRIEPILRILAQVFLYLSIFALSIKSFREPDLWWQIRTGEWILENGQVPKQDVFSYTMPGTEWINIKWGFEVLAAGVSKVLGPESVFIIQAIVSCLLLFFLLRLTRLFLRRIPGREGDTGKKGAHIFAMALSTLLLLVSIEYRIIGRPEMFSHLFTVVFLFILEKYRLQPSKLIFAVIPLQLFWANLHEAFGIGIVLLLIYTGSAWIENIFLKKKSEEDRKRAVVFTVVSLLSTAIVVINPNGFKLLARPFSIMSQVYENKYTTELLNVASADWWAKEAWLTLFFTFCVLISWLFIPREAKSKESWLTRFIRQNGLAYPAVILAFFYLGLTAYRNLIFLALAAFPFVSLQLLKSSQKITGRFRKLEPVLSVASVLLIIFFYFSVVSGRYYRYTKSRDRFGMEVLSIFNPAGAADYVKESNLGGKKCFADYLTSSYLLWKLQPEFRTYIDLRDLDVFPPDFFNSFLHIINSPLAYLREDSIRHFDYVVLYRPKFEALHAYLYNDSVYALKYVDPVAAVFEKTDHFSREDIFTSPTAVPAGGFAMAVNRMLNPFYEPYDYSAVEIDYLAGSYYLNVVRFDLAERRAQKCLADPSYRHKGNELLGQIHYHMSLRDTSADGRAAQLERAEAYFFESLSLNRSFLPGLIGLGTVHFAQGNYQAALSDFKKALAIDDDNYNAQLSCAESYKSLIIAGTSKKIEYMHESLKHYLKANSLNPGNPLVIANIGFTYFQMSRLDEAAHYLSQVADDQGLNERDREAVKNYLRQCSP